MTLREKIAYKVLLNHAMDVQTNPDEKHKGNYEVKFYLPLKWYNRIVRIAGCSVTQLLQKFDKSRPRKFYMYFNGRKRN